MKNKEEFADEKFMQRTEFYESAVKHRGGKDISGSESGKGCLTTYQTAGCQENRVSGKGGLYGWSYAA